MSNEDELVKTLINKTKKQKQKQKQKQKKPNNEQPQQINKLVIDYDQVVIALPHFPKPPKIRINGPKTLLDHTPIKGLFDETRTKKKKKKMKIDEKNETQMGNGVYSNGVDEFDGKDSSFEGKKKKKKENLDETQMGKGVYSNGVDAFEGKEKKKKENLGERDETQMGEGVCSNGVDDFVGLNKVVKRKYGWSKDESVECRFPVNRIVRIIKSQGDDYKLGHEAVFLINKATEKFIELFSEDAYDCALEDKKSFVGYKHLSSAVAKEKRLDFLSDYVPEKITGEKALASRNAAETPPS